MTSKPSATNCPKVVTVFHTCACMHIAASECIGPGSLLPTVSHTAVSERAWPDEQKGGYSCGVPPLPIPNREVKPVRADGTAQAGE